MSPETIEYLRGKLKHDTAARHRLYVGGEWIRATLIPVRVIRDILNDAKASEVSDE